MRKIITKLSKCKAIAKRKTKKPKKKLSWFIIYKAQKAINDTEESRKFYEKAKKEFLEKLSNESTNGQTYSNTYISEKPSHHLTERKTESTGLHGLKDIKKLFEQNSDDDDSEIYDTHIKCENIMKKESIFQPQPFEFEKLQKQTEDPANGIEVEDDCIEREMRSLQLQISSEVRTIVEDVEGDEIIVRCLIDTINGRVKSLIASSKALLRLKIGMELKSFSPAQGSIQVKTAICDSSTQSEEFDMIKYRDVCTYTGNLLFYNPIKRSIRNIEINTLKNSIKVSEGEYTFNKEYNGKEEDEQEDFVILTRSKLQENLLFQVNLSQIFLSVDPTGDSIIKMQASYKVLSEVYFQLIKLCVEMEKEVASLESKKELAELIKVDNTIVENINQYYTEGWKQGYGRGFNRAFQLGLFKGTSESKDLYTQKGFYEGVCDGWQLGFDKGYRMAMKKINEAAIYYNIDLASLGIDQDINNSESVKKAQQEVYNKVFKQSQKPSKIRAYLLLDKFNEFREIKKKRLSKISRRNISRLAYNLLSQYYQKSRDDEDLLEFLYRQSRKVYIVQNLAERRMLNILCSTYCYSETDNIALLFGKFLGIINQGYNKTILANVSKFMSLCKGYTDEFGIEDYEIPTNKCYEFAISSMPDLTKQSQLSIRDKILVHNNKTISVFSASNIITDYIYESTYNDKNKFLNWFNATTLMCRNFITLNEFCTLIFALQVYTLNFKIGETTCSFTINTMLPQLKKYFCIKYKGKFVIHYKDIELISKYTSLFESEYCNKLYSQIPNDEVLPTYVSATIEKLRGIVHEFTSYNTDYVDTPSEWNAKFDYINTNYVKYHPKLIISLLHIWSKGLENVKHRLTEESSKPHIKDDADANEGTAIVNNIIDEKKRCQTSQ